MWKKLVSLRNDRMEGTQLKCPVSHQNAYVTTIIPIEPKWGFASIHESSYMYKVNWVTVLYEQSKLRDYGNPWKPLVVGRNPHHQPHIWQLHCLHKKRSTNLIHALIEGDPRLPFLLDIVVVVSITNTAPEEKIESNFSLKGSFRKRTIPVKHQTPNRPFPLAFLHLHSAQRWGFWDRRRGVATVERDITFDEFSLLKCQIRGMREASSRPRL